jgi:hypothetical protein
MLIGMAKGANLWLTTSHYFVRKLQAAFMSYSTGASA